MKEADIPAVNRLLKAAYENNNAPIQRLNKIRRTEPFRVLVTTILSARTKDQTTVQAAIRLFGEVRKPADLARLTVQQIEKLIFPVGFYHTKARHLHQLPGVMDKRFDGNVPSTIEELCELPGVGRKTANLVMTDAFDKPGICVDVHVHRICNRLGLIRTRNPLESEMALRRILPLRYWKRWNSYLVAYGQTVCFPRTPRCASCPILPHCAQRGVPPTGSRQAPL
jgi:endonuclease III